MTGSVSAVDFTSPVAKLPEDKTVYLNGCWTSDPVFLLLFNVFFFYQRKSAGKLGFGLVPSRTSRPPGKGLIAREDLGVTGSVSVTDLASPVAVLPDDKTVGFT